MFSQQASAAFDQGGGAPAAPPAPPSETPVQEPATAVEGEVSA